MHWIGGMGIIVLILSFLKNLGADAAHMFNAEASVPKPGVVMPRIQSMASKLWCLYIAFTALCFLMLWAGGIEPFDALNYAFPLLQRVDLHQHQQGHLYMNRVTIFALYLFSL